MLVLSRKENESIVIDGRIKITVVKIGGDKIRLGIEAPQDVPILRSELIEAAANSVVIGPFVLSKTSETLALAH
jgi:carbon storage regulator